jgi:hypothetical protein
MNVLLGPVQQVVGFGDTLVADTVIVGAVTVCNLMSEAARRIPSSSAFGKVSSLMSDYYYLVSSGDIVGLKVSLSQCPPIIPLLNKMLTSPTLLDMSASLIDDKFIQAFSPATGSSSTGQYALNALARSFITENEDVRLLFAMMYANRRFGYQYPVRGLSSLATFTNPLQGANGINISYNPHGIIIIANAGGDVQIPAALNNITVRDIKVCPILAGNAAAAYTPIGPHMDAEITINGITCLISDLENSSITLSGTVNISASCAFELKGYVTGPNYSDFLSGTGQNSFPSAAAYNAANAWSLTSAGQNTQVNAVMSAATAAFHAYTTYLLSQNIFANNIIPNALAGLDAHTLFSPHFIFVLRNLIGNAAIADGQRSNFIKRIMTVYDVLVASVLYQSIISIYGQ